MMEFADKFTAVSQRITDFLAHHQTEPATRLTGAFSLFPGHSEWDLYGAIDAVYVLYTIGQLTAVTDQESRQQWSARILACQDETGWFTRRNLRGHSKEHATAYAIGALSLLSQNADEAYVSQIRPIQALHPLLTDAHYFQRWIRHLQFRYTPQDVLHKNVGWHHIWRGSHIGGGVAATIAMTRHLLPQWWPGQVDVDHWFNQYFNWLDQHANPQTGLWQRAFWNVFYRRPTLIDMGGAVHFLWVYGARQRPFPYPEPLLAATLGLQRADGLYKDHPFCIDLDGNFCLTRAYLQLSPDCQAIWRERVYDSVEENFFGIVHALAARPFIEIYTDSHGLPGALAALIEGAKLPGFQYAPILQGWQHPLDKAIWL